MIKNLIILIAVVAVVQLIATYMPELWSLYRTQWVLIIAGLIALIIWWDRLVDWAVSIAHHFWVSPMLIGLTVVAMGTSMPELFVNIIAAMSSESGILVANIVGSNISNLLLIGGTASIIAPLIVKQNVLRVELPISLWAAFVLLGVVQFITPGFLTRVDALILLGCFGLFLIYVVSEFRKEQVWVADLEKKLTSKELLMSFLLVIAWVWWLYVGWETLVNAATTIALEAGLSTVLIGASIVAIGTSIPELVTSVIAALKRQTDLAVGNIVWSNIFNILWIGWITAMVRPVSVPSIVSQDILILMGVTLLVFTITRFHKKNLIVKSAGIFMVLMYVGYLVFLIQRG